MNKALVAGALALLAFSIASCAARPDRVTRPGAGGAVKALAPVEVRTYQGKNLSSVKDFSENSIRGPQTVDIASYRMEVTGLVKTPLRLTYDQVLDRPKYSKVVTLHCVEGWSATILWEGVKVTDILAQAGYDPKAALVIFTAHDGYTTSLPLEYLAGREILLAYRMNQATMLPERGFPFALVAEEKWGYKWIKWVTKMEVSNDTTFRGYWEQRGYSNGGDLDRSFY